ncbi:unnamed protein product [Sphagnum jensenii]|uniref:Uncharacterized protein n=1 Tax=Sphagnum jensenii TaxID=128206 RepID=A0ABP1AWW3_9BRYO
MFLDLIPTSMDQLEAYYSDELEAPIMFDSPPVTLALLDDVAEAVVPGDTYHYPIDLDGEDEDDIIEELELEKAKQKKILQAYNFSLDGEEVVYEEKETTPLWDQNRKRKRETFEAQGELPEILGISVPLVDTEPFADEETSTQFGQGGHSLLCLRSSTDGHSEVKREPQSTWGESSDSDTLLYKTEPQVCESQSSWGELYNFDNIPGLPETLPRWCESQSSWGEVSTNYDPAVKEALPHVPSSQSSLDADVLPSRSASPRKSEELALKAVIEAFSLGDEMVETTPDEGLLHIPLLKHQRIALAWMLKRENEEHSPLGGLLADDQGLGKTISMLALILKNRAPVVRKGFSKGSRTAGTLVVCPVSVLRQWAQEIRDKATGMADLRVLIYHGKNRTNDQNELAMYDVVLTTYTVVGKEVPIPSSNKNSSDSGPIAFMDWFRVVLDEAQTIRNRNTRTAQAACNLHAKHKWCLTGTPIQNSITDLFSYFKFLQYSPWDTYPRFCSDVKSPVNQRPDKGCQKLQAILRPILLRRTKGTLIDGQPIVDLPPRIVKLKKTQFSIEERTFYDKLETESREQFQAFAAAGTVQQNYHNILCLLLILRLACNHPQLIKKSNKISSDDDTALTNLRELSTETHSQLIQCLEGNQSVCPICQDIPEEPVATVCAHVFCKQCLVSQIDTGESECQFDNCRQVVDPSHLYSLPALRQSMTGNANDLVVEVQSQDDQLWRSSSKINAVMDALQAPPETSLGLQRVDIITKKTLVFSQWTKMLDLLEPHLNKVGIQYCRLDGTMSLSAREQAVSKFRTCPEVTVMLISLKAGSVGLNLVTANHVLLVDLWWNPAAEEQAIDRAHRIGQTCPVVVSRFTIENTVEDRILALQERKREIIVSVLGKDSRDQKSSQMSEKELGFLFGL